MSLAKKISELEKGISMDVQRWLTHAILIAAFTPLVLLNQLVHSTPQNNVAPKRTEAVISGSFASWDGYLFPHSVAPKAASEQYQVLAKLLNLRETPNGKVTGSKEIGDVVDVYDSVLADGVLWGKTNGGFIALSEGDKAYAEKTLKSSSTILSQGGVNYLERLLWTEMTPYSPAYPEEDYKQAIMNILNVIDNRAISGIFPQTVLGAIVQDTQFSGLTDSGLVNLLKGKNRVDMRYDKLTIDEIMDFYGLNNAKDSGTLRNANKKLSLIEETVQEYLKFGVKNPMPKDTLFYKNTKEKWSERRWYDSVTGGYLFTTVYVRSDPASIPKDKQHDYYRRVVEPQLVKRQN